MFSNTEINEVRELKGRYPWLIAVAALAFLLLVGRLWSLQLVSGAHYAEISANNFVHKVRLRAPRGLIKDRNGKVLAENRPSYDVLITPAFLPSPRPFLRSLGRILGLGEDEQKALDAQAEAALSSGRSLNELEALPVKEGITPEMEREIFDAAAELEGLDLRDGPRGRTAYLSLLHYPSRMRVLRQLQEFLQLPEPRFRRIVEQVTRAKGLDVFEEIRVAPNVSRDQLRVLTINREILPGVKIQQGTHRFYPLGDRAAHALGYTKEVTESELEKLKSQGYRMGDYIGKIGIERSFEKWLRGVDGEDDVVVDSKGRVKDDEQAREMLRDREARLPVPGNNVVLSLDADLTEVAQEAIAAHPVAAVLALEPATGFLLAVASRPSVDLNRLAGRITREELAELENNPLKPLVSRPLMETYFPGSTWKLITAAAALESEVVTPATRFHCSGSLYFGRRFGCHRSWGHGSSDLIRGMATSCDVYFYHLGMRAGLDRIHDIARRFGFGEKTGLGFQESPGFVPNKDFYRAQNKGYYPAGQDLNNAIGQGDTKVTPLQLALAYAAIGNGGNLMKPQIVRRIETAEGKLVEEFSPVVRRQLGLKPENLKVLVAALTAVTQASFGTAHWRRLREHVIAGKTGTSQRGGVNITKKDHLKAWYEKDDALFVGFSPPQNPEIVAVAVIERGGHGASVAMPIVNRVVKAYFDLKAARAGTTQAAAEPPTRGESPAPVGLTSAGGAWPGGSP
jgi:penicillin-binding protein 2